jgi:hypothetical protein
MEQQSQSDSQESMQFGEVDPTTEQLVLNNSQDNSQPLIGILMLCSLKKYRIFSFVLKNKKYLLSTEHNNKNQLLSTMDRVLCVTLTSDVFSLSGVII